MGYVARTLGALLALALISAAVADSTPPNFSPGYPAVTSVDGSGFDLEVKSSEAGKVFYYVVAGSSPTPPTPAQLKSQYASAYGSVTILQKGEITVTADTLATASISGLSENQVLSVFLVAEDAEATPNLQAAVTDLALTTADDTPPTFVAGFPKVTEIKTTGFNLVVELNEPGLFHWMVVPSGSTAPTLTEMADGTNADKLEYSTVAGVSVDAGALQKTVGVSSSNLLEATDYDVYVLARDNNGANGGSQIDNVQSAVFTFALTTADGTPPSFESTYPSVSSETTVGFALAVSLDEVGSVAYFVVLKSDDPPTALEVAGQASSYRSVVVLKKGTVAVTTATTQVDITLTGLDDLTEYSVYVVPADDGNVNTVTNAYYSVGANVANVAARVNATTTDGTPPVFVGAYTPGLAQIDGTSFDIVTQLDEPGDVFYVVVKRTTEDPPTAPTAAETKSGNFANVVACGTFYVASADVNVTETVVTTANPESDPNCSPDDCSLCPLLDSESQYWVYLIAEDKEATPNTQQVATTRNVTTTDVTPPTFKNETASTLPVFVSSNAKALYAYAPNLGGVALEVTTSLDEPGTVFYMATLASDTAPTSAQVKACGASRDGDRASIGTYTYSSTTPIACGFKEFLVARVETKFVLFGAPPEVALTVYVVAEDFEDQREPHAGLAVNPPTVNLQPAVTAVDVTAADIDPPVFATVSSVPYPLVKFSLSGDVTNDKAALQVALNEPGTIHYVVVTRDLTFHPGYTDDSKRQTPSAAEVRAGTGPGGLAAADSGSVSVTTADTVVDFDTSVVALTQGTAYDVYIVAEDDYSPINEQGDAGVVKLRFSTRDATAPTFGAASPAVVIRGVAVEITVVLDEPGAAFFVVVARGDTAPTSAEVVAGVDYGSVTVVAECGSTPGDFDVPKSATPVSCTVVSGLVEATDYDVYVVAEDIVDVSVDGGRPFPSANLVANPVKIPITTADTSAPLYNSGPDISSIGTDGVSVDFVVDLTEAGKVWYVVDLFANADPTPGKVKMGVSATGGAVAAAGSFVAGAGVTVTGSIANQALKSETAYYVHVAAQDGATPPNLASVIVSVAFTTPDTTPPKFVGQYTKAGAISAVDAQSFDLTVALSEVGVTYFVVVEKGESSGITADDVRNLRGGIVGAARTVVACGAFEQAVANTNATVTIATDLTDTTACSGFTGIGDNDPIQSHFPALVSGGASMTDAPQCQKCPILTPNTEYDVYIVAEDDGGHAFPSAAYVDAVNLQLAATKVSTPFFPSSATVASLKTADDIAPVWVGSPNATNFFGDGFDIEVALNEPGVVFYSVVKNDACAVDPTNAKVLTGSNGCDDASASVTHGSFAVTTANTRTLHTVSGLDSARGKESYKVWVFAEDNEPSGMSSLLSANTQAAPVSVTAETLDTQPPLFDTNYPVANNPVSSTGKGALTVEFDVVVKLDEPATVFYVAFPTSDLSESNAPGSTPPSAANVAAGVDSTGTAAAVAGSFAVTDTTATTDTVTAVLDSTSYTVYVVAKDSAGSETRVTRSGSTPSDNLSPVHVATVTTADGTAVLFTGNPCATDGCLSNLYNLDHSKYPFMSDCAADEFTLTVAVAEASSKVHYVVVAYADATALAAQSDPTMEEVSLGTDPYTPTLTGAPVTLIASGTIPCTDADTEYVETVTSLGGNTLMYQVFVTTEGPNGNLGDGDVLRTVLENPTKLAPCVAPQLSDNTNYWYQKLVTWPNTSDDTTLQADVFLTSAAVVYYVLLKRGSDAPTPTQIIVGQDSHGDAPPCADCDFADNGLSNTAGSTECGFDGVPIFDDGSGCTVTTFTGLSSSDEYDFYMVTKHATGSLDSDNTGPDGSSVVYGEFSRSVVGPVAARTTDTTAPFFVASYPKTVDVTGVSATLVARLTETGKVWWVVLDKGATAPSAAQVKAGTDSAGVAVTKTSFAGVSAVTSGETDILVPLSGLTSKKTYDVYLLAKDDDTAPYGGNDQPTVTKKEITAASVDASLSGISVKTVVGTQTTTHTIQPVFASTIFEYRTFVNVTTSSVMITLTANDTQSDGLITVNGTQRAAPFVAPVGVGKNVFVIRVTAGDGLAVSTYQYTITRAFDDTVRNASLAVLDVTMDDGVVLNSTDLGGARWPFCVKGCDQNSRARCSVVNPECVMDSLVTKYVASVPQRIGTISIAATAFRASSGATVKIFVKGGVSSTGAVLNDASRSVSLASLKETGGGVITLVVTAGDRVTKKTYTITVDRYGPGVYGEGYAPPSAGGSFATHDAFTTRAGADPTVRDLTVIPKLDTSPPTFLASYPQVTAGAVAGTLDLVVQLSEPGVVYYVVLPDAARAPTAREVKEAGVLRADALAVGTISDIKSLTRETSLSVTTGLAATTVYDVWLVAEDDAKDYDLEAKPNLQLAPVRLNVTTL